MDTIQEEARGVPVAEECDLCVIGGGATGVFAAVRAARLGARVALVEQNGFFGGVATAGLVNIWHSLYDTDGKHQVIGGLTAEVLDRLTARSACFTTEAPHRMNFLNTEELKIELDRLVGEAKVRPFLHAWFAAPLWRDGELTAVAIEDKSGRRAIRAKYFVDASGDGDLVTRAGYPVYKRQQLQPPTTCMLVDGVRELMKEKPDFHIEEAVFDPRFAHALRPGFLWHAPVIGSPTALMIAGTRVHEADCSDADQLTRAEIEGRRQARAICDLIREHAAGDRAIALLSLPSYIGVRETRHARCRCQVKGGELLAGAAFPDTIGHGTYPTDIHNAVGGGIVFRHLDGTEREVTPGRPTRHGRWRPLADDSPKFYSIPFGALVPQGATNLLIAGRLIDADPGAYGALRVMVNCNQTGEAAGAAAWRALDSGASVQAVDTERLRVTLRRHGALLA